MTVQQHRGRTFDRIPSKPDARDYRARDYVPLSKAPYPTKIWDVQERLDQGNTGHCVGFSDANFGNTLPIDDHFTNADGDKFYYSACALGGYPNTEDGSTVRDGAKALQAAGRIASYAFAGKMDEIKAWVTQTGPVLCGTDWTDGMMDTDAQGYVAPTGTVVGGHAYTLIGYDALNDAFVFINSWSASWGTGGLFKMRVADFAKLFANGGEACVTSELPLSPTPTPAPTPVPPGNGCLAAFASYLQKATADPNIATNKRLVRALNLMIKDLSKAK